MKLILFFCLMIVCAVLGQEDGKCDTEAEFYCQHDAAQCIAKVGTLGLPEIQKCDCYVTWLTCINMGCPSVSQVQSKCKEVGCLDEDCLTGAFSHHVKNEFGTTGVSEKVGSDASAVAVGAASVAAVVLAALF